MRCLLFFQAKNSANRQHVGFTLIEILVVIFVLAAIAGAVVLSFDGVQNQGRIDATKFEMAELRKALLKFRHDSGSRDFPGQGIYDCDNDPSADTNIINPLIDPNLPTDIASLSSAAKVDWCLSEANFWMLFEDPLATGWNADTHRGWNGPYLRNKQASITYSGIDNIRSISTPYNTPYLLIDLSNDNSAAIVSIGENDSSGAINACSSTDDDDSVVCLLR